MTSCCFPKLGNCFNVARHLCVAQVPLFLQEVLVVQIDSKPVALSIIPQCLLFFPCIQGSEEEGNSFGSLARRALQETAWVPDEEEKEILIRAIKRLRQRLSADLFSERQQRLERLANRAEAKPAKAQPLHVRCSNPLIVADYSIAKDELEESPPSPRRRGILRASAMVSADLSEFPMNSTTASAAFSGFAFPSGNSPDSKTSSSPASPTSPRNPLRLPGNIKQRMSMVSIADEDELVEIDDGSQSLGTPRKSTSLSESSTTAVETARSSVARSSVFLKSPRHSLANLFRWKNSEAGPPCTPMDSLRRNWEPPMKPFSHGTL